jgi:fumarate hydratase class II
MPGKVNPVLAEMLDMAMFHVIGCDATIAIASQAGQLELNVMMPVIAYALDQSISLLAHVASVFADRCITGITANVERCTELLEGNLSLATALVPAVGYDEAASIAKQAFREGKTARQVAAERGVLPPAELERLLDARSMTGE